MGRDYNEVEEFEEMGIKKQIGCKCLPEIDKLLATRNTKLVVASGLLTGETYMVVATEKLDSTKRGRATLVTANFCPFCAAPQVERKKKAPPKKAATKR